MVVDDIFQAAQALAFCSRRQSAQAPLVRLLTHTLSFFFSAPATTTIDRQQGEALSLPPPA